MNRVEQLGDEARALVAATRDAYEPTASNRAQVLWGVERKLSSQPPPRLGFPPHRTVLALAAAAVVIGGVGAAAAFAWRVSVSASEAPQSIEPVAIAAPVPAALAPAAPAAEEPVDAAPSAAPAPSQAGRAASKPRSPARRSGDLSAETSLIARAQAATNRGQGDQALKLLEEYDRKFARGALAEERAAARVFALCSAGKRDAARADASRFLARWPRSPQAARVRRACQAENP